MKRLTQAKLFVDTGDPQEVKQVQSLLTRAGYAGLDGATTNPSYFAKNPQVQERIKRGRKYTQTELLRVYRSAVEEIDEFLGGGRDVSIEVYADKGTQAEEMMDQAREMSTWVERARIKLPIIEEGLKAAEALKDELLLNMTLCFSQQQAAAVYAATRGAKKKVVISPFIGRFEDKGENGAQFVENVIKMLSWGDGYVKVLAASFRSAENVLEMISAGVDIMTINLERWQVWSESRFKLPGKDFKYSFEGKDISYEEVDLGRDWRDYNIQHELTDVGLQRFADDWNKLLKR